MRGQYDKLDEDYQKDKVFYEEALEARMNQMEQLESENEALNRRAEDARRREIDMQAHIEQLEFDIDMNRHRTAQGGS